MHIFHVSEEDDIQEFQPRIPTRKDLDSTKGLVWAIEERCLPNFLTPRYCPRVCFHVGPYTSDDDQQMFLSSSCQHVVVIENKWFEQMINTKIYLYEFDSSHFTLQDENAGYYVSDTAQLPINKIEIDNPIQELFRRQVEVRFVDQLWDLHDDIQRTTFHWSLCRMRYAEPRN